MKKILILPILMGILALTSCSKENPKPCNCGTITNIGIDTLNKEWRPYTDCHWLEISNECSGNKKKFCYEPTFWSKQTIDSNICLGEEKPW
jgi:hypothetical protein